MLVVVVVQALATDDAADAPHGFARISERMTGTKLEVLNGSGWKTRLMTPAQSVATPARQKRNKAHEGHRRKTGAHYPHCVLSRLGRL